MKIKYSDIIKKQPLINLGMIGHVASGKSTLTREITGIKTQKFASEKIRNITIEIGYANAKIFIDKNGQIHTASSNTDTLQDEYGNDMKLIQHISIVDCPGHESFMSNMINGSAVMDACVLVIASNEQIPQPQTYEHLQAVESININNFIILQNKLDLIEEKDNYNILDKINKFIKGTKAEKSKIIPTSVQKGINVNEVIKSIVKLSTYNKKINKPSRMTLIRSFDINKANVPFHKLQGGVVGGSLTQGVLNINDIIELRPGLLIKENGKTKYKPLLAKVTSLKSDNRELEYAFPGGLIGVGLSIDASLTKNNNMVGQLLGEIGTLPPVYEGLKVTYTYIKRYDKLDCNFVKNEKIIICVNSMRINGTIKTLKRKRNKMGIQLEKPICLSKDQTIVILKKIRLRWILVATSVFNEGLEYEMIKPNNYDNLIKNKKLKNIEIINDFNNSELEKECEYYDLIDNIQFKNNFNYKLNVKPPIVKYVYPISTLKNYQEIIKSINLTPDECKMYNYNDLLYKFFKSELSCEGEINQEKKLCLRGRFNNKNVEKVLINFINKYLKCISCGSPRCYLCFKDKITYRNCLTCSSISSVKN